MIETQRIIERYINPYGYIYIIKNKINEKKYVGQTTNKKGVRCLMTQIGMKNCYTNNHYLINSVNKYGINNFERKIIDSASDKEELDKKEEFYIQKYNTLDPKFGYNLKHGGSNGKLTEEMKKKISKALKGREFSEETKKKMSDIKKKLTKEKAPFYGKKHSNKSKEMISKKNKKYHFTREYLIQEYWISEYNMENRILDSKQKSANEIAKENNCSRMIIQINLIENNIMRRNSSESAKLDWKKKKK